MRSRGTRWIALAFAAGLAVSSAAACGSDDDNAADTVAPTTDSAPGTAPTSDPAVTEPTGPAETPAPTAAPTTVGSTDPPTTDPPTTAPPTTAPPATDPPTTAPPSSAPPVTEPATDPPPTGKMLVNVYWAWEVQNTGNATPERIAAGARTVAADTPVRNALEALFAGTNPTEDDIGMLTLIPAGTRVLGIAVDGTTATVDLSAEFETTLGGTLAETVQLAQVVFTVTQFDGFDRVRFHIDGELRDPILTHGFEVGDGLSRDDFANVRAVIMIESPFPGQAVGDPLVVRGESTAFEATIQWILTAGGGDGVVVAEGFVTDGGASGVWAPFEFSIDLDGLPDYEPGPGSIILYESSPVDGSQTWLVEIPIVLPEP